ncbi:RDD family protein [Paraflavitalea sp. CAU 1676]|uniref:RDD family protein n=1 Tax=Paraflavitalea sp. CAU 1676 TaxID=3032598 RepID=UPI0023DCE8D5|nr:RDD family protein [Paraflavitalea sp. CAU 1676]MDF2187586.1 RDD family protein [Paraflavitalea sp. CAU 1676]
MRTNRRPYPVSPGLRFANMLIDTLALYAVMFILGIFLGLMLAASAIDGEPYTDESGGSLQLLLLFAWFFIILGYYSIFEFASNGRTLGKMATGTVVVREDGAKITFKDAFLRSLCLIPFEALSAFGYRPWHDSLTNTLVVKKNK